MAKQKPTTNTSSNETTKTHVSAVNVDSPSEPKKVKKAPAKKTNEKPNIFKRMGKAIKGVFSELKKVSWPKAKQIGKNTAVVLIVVVIFFLIMLLIDYLLGGVMGLVVDGKWATMFI